jgi:transcriptional regulator NrdR family protein
MQCPKCLSKTKVLETRKDETYNAWVNEFRQDWPDIVYRRRRCLACEKTFGTLELPIDDIKEIAKGTEVPG